jgi:aspartate racemase
MKSKFCLIGGLGPESTIDYYKLLIEHYQSLKGEEEYPEILINSLNINKLLGMVAIREFDKLTDCY